MRDLRGVEMTLPSSITFRPINDDDRDFLARLYASTRAEEMAAVPWDQAEKDQFLTFQFSAQHTYYQDNFKAASFDLIVQDDVPIGRLYLDRRPDEHRLIDIALLPEHRGTGLGTRLMNHVLADAGAEGKKVRIHVEQNNPAMRLYRRLGFREVEDQGVYRLMEWCPAASTADKETE